MLNKVKELALIKFAGDQEAADEFVKGFIKVAMATEAPRSRSFSASTSDVAAMRKIELDERKHDFEVRQKGTLGTVRNSFMGELGKGTGNLLVTLGIAGVGSVYKGIQNNNLHTKFLTSLEKAISSNQIIKSAKKEKVLEYANTIFKFAPNVATDVNLLTAILTNSIHGDGIDPMTIKTLTELEGRFSENDSFSPKTYI
jgi:hypothetical protein